MIMNNKNDHIGSTITVGVAQDTVDLFNKVYRKMVITDQFEMEDAIYQILKSIERRDNNAKASS